MRLRCLTSVFEGDRYEANDKVRYGATQERTSEAGQRRGGPEKTGGIVTWTDTPNLATSLKPLIFFIGRARGSVAYIASGTENAKSIT